jgi:hypothetical protein
MSWLRDSKVLRQVRHVVLHRGSESLLEGAVEACGGSFDDFWAVCNGVGLGEWEDGAALFSGCCSAIRSGGGCRVELGVLAGDDGFGGNGRGRIAAMKAGKSD